jgi:hypothetical protein
MKTKNLGIVLIILGAIMMVYTGFNFITTKNVVDIGDIKIDKTEDHPVQWSPILGGVLLVGGVILVAANKK